MQCLYLVSLEEFEKMVALSIVVQHSFQKDFGHYTDQNS